MEIINRWKTSVIMALLCVTALSLKAQDTLAIGTQAQEYAHALEKANWEAVMDQTFPPLLEKNGGRQKMIAQAKASMQDMQARGFTLKKAELSTPLGVYHSGDYLMSVVPMRLTFDGALGKIYSESSILAVSSDEGNSWKFIDMAQVQMIELTALFPAINPNMKIPVKRIYQE